MFSRLVELQFDQSSVVEQGGHESLTKLIYFLEPTGAASRQRTSNSAYDDLSLRSILYNYYDVSCAETSCDIFGRYVFFT